MARDPEDVVIQIKDIHGYPSFADFISSDPDRRTVMYRRFDFLSARNLLSPPQAMWQLAYFPKTSVFHPN
jgi:hypothetical protein